MTTPINRINGRAMDTARTVGEVFSDSEKKRKKTDC